MKFSDLEKTAQDEIRRKILKMVNVEISMMRFRPVLELSILADEFFVVLTVGGSKTWLLDLFLELPDYEFIWDENSLREKCLSRDILLDVELCGEILLMAQREFKQWLMLQRVGLNI